MWLVKQRPYRSKVLAVGDWNIDQLPTLDNDPFADRPSREWHHWEGRSRLDSCAGQFRLQILLPEMVASVPGGPLAALAISCIPVGEQATIQTPSLLDYTLASEVVVKSSKLHWYMVFLPIMR